MEICISKILKMKQLLSISMVYILLFPIWTSLIAEDVLAPKKGMEKVMKGNSCSSENHAF